MRKAFFSILVIFLISLGCGTSNDTVTHNSTPTISIIPTQSETPSGTTNELKVHFLDIGSGNSIFIELDETEILIFRDYNIDGISGYLDSFVVGPLDAIILDNPNLTGKNGLLTIMENFDVSAVWFYDELSAIDSEFLSSIEKLGIAINEAPFDDIIVSDISFHVIYPTESHDISNSALFLNYNQIDFLFAGNVDQETVMNMNKGEVLPEVEFLELNCYDFDIPVSSDLLQVTDPDVIVFTGPKSDIATCTDDYIVSELDILGHHHRTTLTDGTVVVYTGGIGYSVKCSQRPGTLLSVNPS